MFPSQDAKRKKTTFIHHFTPNNSIATKKKKVTKNEIKHEYKIEERENSKIQ